MKLRYDVICIPGKRKEATVIFKTTPRIIPCAGQKIRMWIDGIEFTGIWWEGSVFDIRSFKRQGSYPPIPSTEKEATIEYESGKNT